jgi:hypothetical protein
VKRLRDSQNSTVKKEKSSCERLRDSQNSTVKKEKSSCERLHDSQNSIVKEEEYVKGLCDSRRLHESLNPTVKGIPTEKALDNDKFWPKSHRQRDSHRRGLRQQQVVA